ncbi:MAG: ATP-dependent DNA helicase RecG [Dehalococcoidia bacterium]|nr:ATP-dependent DNA helicase RecG [Dehalococcoidia bacterium]
MTADLSLLDGVLRRVLDDDCDDGGVEGGLDDLLRRQAFGEQPGSPLLRMFAHLPPEGFRALPVDDRRTWLRRALATIAAEHAKPRRPRPPQPRNGASEADPAPTSNGRPRPPRARSGHVAPGEAPTPAAPAVPTPAAPRAVGSASTRASADPGPSPDRPKAARKIAPGAAGLDLELARAGTGLRAPTLERLARLGLETVGDALRHYPYRHHDFSITVPVAQLRVGVEQTVRGHVAKIREVRMGRGGRLRSTEATVVDEYGTPLRVIWFNQPFIVRSLPEGSEIALAGNVKAFRGHPTLENPEFERLDGRLPLGAEGGAATGAHTGRIVPVYRLTEGLPQRTLRALIAGLLERFGDRIPDPLPPEVRREHDLMTAAEAVQQVHYPDSPEALTQARRRLAFEELLAIQLGVQRRKRDWAGSGNAPILEGRTTAEAFLGTLPYTLTAAQRAALEDVLRDVERRSPMARLVEGDVGSGKTVVALAAMLAAVSSGFQAVLMAPTEVLAEQHFRTICRLLSGEPEPPLGGLLPAPFLPLPLRAVLLTGSTRTKERRDALDAIRHGGAQIVVGTHALIEDTVAFHRLGLAVVDEQHRFGVMQRAKLREKGNGAYTPHLLVMTATPIPRSLALAVYGDLDLSIIDELPPGRAPIETRWLPPEQRHEAFAQIRRELDAGRQAFVICPLVEGSDTVASRAATEEYDRLRLREFPDLADRIALLHGRMSAKDKDAAMRAFGRDETKILVSTAVVEVGIDVPNATVMVIEGADRFGMAQLHQFRGRVGRGQWPSTCYLLADEPSDEAVERLQTVARTRDGFALAEADLKLRGAGDFFGTRQSGAPSLRVASLLDAQLIAETRAEAERLLNADPELASREHIDLRLLALRTADGVVNERH